MKREPLFESPAVVAFGIIILLIALAELWLALQHLSVMLSLPVWVLPALVGLIICARRIHAIIMCIYLMETWNDNNDDFNDYYY